MRTALARFAGALGLGKVLPEGLLRFWFGDVLEPFDAKALAGNRVVLTGRLRRLGRAYEHEIRKYLTTLQEALSLASQALSKGPAQSSLEHALALVQPFGRLYDEEGSGPAAAMEHFDAKIGEIGDTLLKAKTQLTHDPQVLSGDVGRYLASTNGDNFAPGVHVYQELVRQALKHFQSAVGVGNVFSLDPARVRSVSLRQLMRDLKDSTLANKAAVILDPQIEAKRSQAPEPSALVDLLKLETVLTNLVDNATRALAEHESSDAAPVVHLGVDAYGHPQISVTDAGPGIDRGVLRHAFDLLEGRKQQPPNHGHGIGLPNVLLLTAAMDAQIVVQTQKGRGTRWTISLPKAEGVVDAMEQFAEHTAFAH